MIAPGHGPVDGHRRRHRLPLSCALAGLVVLASCGGTSTSASTTATTGSPGSSTTGGTTGPGGGSGLTRWSGSPVSRTAIPLGDGKVSTAPEAGAVDSCTSRFRVGGARHSGPWIDAAAGTWNATTKVHVECSNSWPDASHAFTLSGWERALTTDDLPVGRPTGNFPISTTDPAHEYDTNPNSVSAQSFRWTVPADPAAASAPSCVGLGPVGVSTDGVVFFDALDAAGRDAGAHEIQDSCDGHPQAAGIYHYHTVSPCLPGVSSGPGSSTLVGYALDGYGIYAERDAHGNLPTDADLDACHGRTSAVTWDGGRVVMYHYDMTTEYPYTLGCYHGTPVATGPTHL